MQNWTQDELKFYHLFQIIEQLLFILSKIYVFQQKKCEQQI